MTELSWEGVSLTDYPRLAGECDDTARLQRAVDGNPGGVLLIPAGTYLLSSALHIDNRCSVRLAKNAVLRACAPMDFLVIWNGGNENLFHDYNLFFCGGTLDGSAMAGGLKLRNIHHFILRDTWYKDCTTGLCVGDPADFKNYELCASDLYFRNEVGIPDSIGVSVPCFGDHYFDRIVVVDYQTGFSLNTYTAHLTKCHSWVTDLIPDMEKTVAFDLSGSLNNLLTDCYADTAHIGLNIRSGEWRIQNITGYHNVKYGGKGHISLYHHGSQPVYIDGGHFCGSEEAGDRFFAGEHPEAVRHRWLVFTGLAGTEPFAE